MSRPRLPCVPSSRKPSEEPEMASLPDGWGQTLTGEPMPNVVAAVHRSRDGR